MLCTGVILLLILPTYYYLCVPTSCGVPGMKNFYCIRVTLLYYTRAQLHGISFHSLQQLHWSVAWRKENNKNTFIVHPHINVCGGKISTFTYLSLRIDHFPTALLRLSFFITFCIAAFYSTAESHGPVNEGLLALLEIVCVILVYFLRSEKNSATVFLLHFSSYNILRCGRY